MPPRIIPANTGRIVPGADFADAHRDHPREYGENYGGLDMAAQAVGSSPRIRGEWCENPPLEGQSGIIPANTGRIFVRRVSSAPDTDHPREYGENDISAGFVAGGTGSSPRIRGEYMADQNPVYTGGIIPANTGRISPKSSATILTRDHPREYGENLKCGLSFSVTGGSSPRIRGEYRSPRHGGRDRGIIPANTGRMSTPVPAADSIHGSSPRIRGEFRSASMV